MKLHIIPLNDIVAHVMDLCACKPIKTITDKGNTIYKHRSADKREEQEAETQTASTGKAWTIKYEI